LYLQKREAFYEAILGGVILLPEGEHDYDWLRLLQRVVESSDKGSLNILAFSVVPTQDSAIVDTYSEVARFSTNILPIVDGDSPGEDYLKRLCKLSPRPRHILRLGDGAGIEFVAAWVLEPALSNPGRTLSHLLSQTGPSDVKKLQRALTLSTNKKDRELREGLAAEALENPICVSRAAEFFADISAILSDAKPRNKGWKEIMDATGSKVHVACHICRE
jgi:hypothetical protein